MDVVAGVKDTENTGGGDDEVAMECVVEGGKVCGGVYAFCM